jgi:WD40 repeat protein
MCKYLWLGVALVLASAAPGAPFDDTPKDAPLPKGALARLGKPEKKSSQTGTSVVFAPDGKSVTWVSATANAITVHVWDVALRKEICQSRFAEEEAQATTSLAFTPDGKHVAVCTYHEGGGPAKITRFGESRIRLWDAATGKEVSRFEGQRGGDGTEFHSLAMASDGKTVITSRSDSVQVWDLAGGKLVQQFAFSKEEEGGVLFELLSPDGKRFASRLNANPVGLWDVAAGKKLHDIKDAGDPVAFSPDAGILAAADPDRIRLWATDTGKEIGSIKGTGRSAAFAPDGKVLAWVEMNRTVRVAEVRTGKEIHGYEAEGGPLAFSPDGKHLAAVCRDGTLLLWKVEAGK